MLKRGGSILAANYIIPYNATYVSVGPIKPPAQDTDPATKRYVDDHSAVPPNMLPPLQYDANTHTMWVDPATASASGVVSTAAQVFSGEKTFNGTVRVPTMPVGDSSSAAATTEFVSIADRNCNYEPSNGWISGGVVTLAPDGLTFDVSAMTCRFTDYTNESSPVPGDVVTFSAKTGIASGYPSVPDLAVFVDNFGSLYQQPSAFDATKINDNMIRIARIPQVQGVMVGVCNDKFPLASRFNNIGAEFINRLAPLNVGKNLVGPSGNSDMAISVGPGNYWFQNANVTTDRNTPSIVSSTGVNSPTLYGMWMDTSGTIHVEPGVTQIPTTLYNPGGTGASLQEIPSGAYVVIPIMYDPGARIYAFQYPTEHYKTDTSADMAIGMFTRLHGTDIHFYVIIGYLVVEKGTTVLTSYMCKTGEFFNYSSSGNSRDMDVFETTQSNVAWVDQKLGDDSDGTVARSDRPFYTFNAAANAIGSSATISDPYTVICAAGDHIESTMVLRPFVSVNGYVSSTLIEVASGEVTLSPLFSTANSGQISLFTLRLIERTGLNFDFQAVGGSLMRSNAVIINCLIQGPISYTGRIFDSGIDNSSGDAMTVFGSYLESPVTIDGGMVTLNSCMPSDPRRGSYITIRSTVADSRVSIVSSRIDDLSIIGTVPGVQTVVELFGCNINNLILEGDNVTLYTDRSSMPDAAHVTITGGSPQYIYTGRGLSDDQFSALNNASPSLSATNYVVGLQALNTALSSKANASATINGHALSSAPIVVMAGDLPNLGAGGTKLDHTLLDIQSGDLPATIASNTTGTAANLTASLGQTLPSGVRAVTQAYSDNSTLIATTAFVAGQKGSANGIASLDSNGKVPNAQLDLSTLGTLVYKGTWDASLGYYPSNPSSGYFYIINVAGTISGVEYNIGDWIVYNGTSWDKISSDVASYLSTWTGNTYISSVGTIVTGTWNATVISKTKGGAGDVLGILYADGAGNVSAATDSQIVLQGTTANITGAKTFTGSVYAPTISSTMSSTTAVATTAFVQAAANVQQSNIVFRSATGLDTNTGLSINQAVLTFAKALTLCTPKSASEHWTIRCFDASDSVESFTVPTYVSLYCKAMCFSGTYVVEGKSSFTAEQVTFDTYSSSNVAVNFSGVSTESTTIVLNRVVNGKITANSGQGICTAQVGFIEQPSSTDEAIYCNGTALNPTILYVISEKVVGKITANGSGATVDLTRAGDLSGATFSAINGGQIYYPTFGAGNVNGLLKCDGAGVVTQAIPGSQPSGDYLVQNDTITLGGVLTGSGSTSITAALVDSSVSLAKLANLASGYVLGNMSVPPVSQAPAPVATSSSNTASTVVYRDSHSNCTGSHFSEQESARSTVGISHYTQLTVDDVVYQYFTGDNDENVVLPDCTTLPSTGFRFHIFNSNVAAGMLYIWSYGPGTNIVSIKPGETVQCICTSVLTAVGNWVTSLTNRYQTLTGDVTGSGRGTIPTTISAGVVTWGAGGKLAALPSSAGYVLGSLSSTVVSSLAARAASTADAVVVRDSSQNSYFNNCISTIASFSSTPASLTGASPRYQRYTGSSAATLTLPTTASFSQAGADFYVINDGTGILTVKNSSSTTLQELYTGRRARFTSTNTTSPGTWSMDITYPATSGGTQGLFTNPFTNSGTGTYTIDSTNSANMTAVHMFEGPISVNHTGGNIGTLYLADATSNTNMFAYLTTRFGSLPPVGFYWTTYVYSINGSIAIGSPSGSVDVFGSTSKGQLAATYTILCTITSSSTYRAMCM